MKVLAIISQKGGVGKTTIATSLAVAAEAKGQTAVVLDLDDQATACFWHDTRQAVENARAEAEGRDPEPVRPSVRDVKPVRLPAILEALRGAGCDLVVLDCPPIAKDTAALAAGHADFALIPTRAATLDMASMTTTLAQLSDLKTPCAVLFNFTPPSGPEVENACQALARRGVEIAPTLGHRKAFERAPSTGQTAQESEPDSKAAAEIAELYSYSSIALYKNDGETEHVEATRR